MQNLSDAVDDAVARTVAIIGLLGIALIHILQAPEAYTEKGYLGALFTIAVIAAVMLAAAMTRTSDADAWTAVGGLAGLILLGYLVSRTVGLPGATDDVGEWTEPLGLASMVVEGLLVCLAVGVLATRRTAVEGAVPAQGRRWRGAAAA